MATPSMPDFGLKKRSDKENEPPTPEELKKQQWAREMRLKFSPPEMLHEDGSLNLEYFKPKAIVKERKWTDKERKALLRGIEKFGVGNWKDMKEDGLGEWDYAELRVKTQVLLGRQSLKYYKGWQGTEEDIEKEHQRNYNIGQECGTWKGNVLVADEEGKVSRRIKETVISEIEANNIAADTK